MPFLLSNCKYKRAKRSLLTYALIFVEGVARIFYGTGRDRTSKKVENPNARSFESILNVRRYIQFRRENGVSEFLLNRRESAEQMCRVCIFSPGRHVTLVLAAHRMSGEVLILLHVMQLLSTLLRITALSISKARSQSPRMCSVGFIS